MSLYTRIIDLQKLTQAWERVKKNKPAAGVDNVTFELFGERVREELKQLQIELQQQTYEALPVRKVTLYKEEKSREIALYSMRDKVVQQSVAQELNKLYDPDFSPSTYAYRNNKSALVALETIEKNIRENGYTCALKVDIRHFFDTISWNKMEAILKKRVREEPVLYLIRQNSTTKVLEDTGEIVEKERGIHQGSAISPILSNIYLMDFDIWLTSQENIFFVRYSDDILILGKSKEELFALLTKIRLKLNELELDINEDKTYCVDLEEGVEFLGHRFDRNGKSIPQKARKSLRDRLEVMWLTSPISFEEKVKKAITIVGGWEQYFREEREIESIFEFLALLTKAQQTEEYRDVLSKKRTGIVNIYKDVAQYLGNIWNHYGLYEMELFEYEQFYQIPMDSSERNTSGSSNELLEQYRCLLINESEETMTEIMQIYSDLHRFEAASIWMERKEKRTRDEKTAEDIIPTSLPKDAGEGIVFDQKTAWRIQKIFAGREDVYSLESLGNGGKRQTETQLEPLTETVIVEHLTGIKTVGTYIQRPNRTVRSVIIDVDVSKKVLLQYNRESMEFREYLKKALAKAFEVVKIYRNLGIEGYVEYSGCRGYHVWLLFSEWIPVRYANMFCELIEGKIEKDDDISIEIFPNKTALKPGKYGQCMKLPFGRHIRTGEMSYFIDENGLMLSDINGFLDSIARYQLTTVKKILASNTEFKENVISQNITLDEAFTKELPDTVKTVLNNCNLMKYLCQKAQKTGYLSHFERLSILYVFGHLGDDGKNFIHQIIGMTLNYQYQTTEKFISRIPDKPISCLKLRDQYKSITAEYGCSCNFKRSKNCYPSPVLHAITLSNTASESITVPTSRSMTKEKEQKVIEELNIHKKAEELAKKILEMKKQKRRLDSSITKTENELSKIYDDEGIDCLEIEMGLLVRRKTADGKYEWVIEI